MVRFSEYITYLFFCFGLISAYWLYQSWFNGVSLSSNSLQLLMAFFVCSSLIGVFMATRWAGAVFDLYAGDFELPQQLQLDVPSPVFPGSSTKNPLFKYVVRARVTAEDGSCEIITNAYPWLAALSDESITNLLRRFRGAACYLEAEEVSELKKYSRGCRFIEYHAEVFAKCLGFSSRFNYYVAISLMDVVLYLKEFRPALLAEVQRNNLPASCMLDVFANKNDIAETFVKKLQSDLRERMEKEYAYESTGQNPG